MGRSLSHRPVRCGARVPACYGASSGVQMIRAPHAIQSALAGSLPVKTADTGEAGMALLMSASAASTPRPKCREGSGGDRRRPTRRPANAPAPIAPACPVDSTERQTGVGAVGTYTMCRRDT